MARVVNIRVVNIAKDFLMNLVHSMQKEIEPSDIRSYRLSMYRENSLQVI